MADINSLVEQLGKLTLQEAADLANKLEEEWHHEFGSEIYL